MTTRGGHVPGATPHERAVRLAGALAELGATRLTLAAPGKAVQELAARRTDLPGLIASAETGTVLECAAFGIRIRIAPDQLVWEADSDEQFERFHTALGSGASN